VADLPEGYRQIPEEDQKKANAFFERGKTVAGTGNYDYAIEMYLQGLNVDPEAVPAHQALRDISMKRKASGGKGMGMKDKWGLKKGDDKQNMLNAEKLLAYDPGETSYMVTLMEAAQKGGFFDTVMWIGAIALQANSSLPKPDFSNYIKIKNAYLNIRRYDKANDAMKYAVAMKPDDGDLAREARDIAATNAMKEGGYDKGGSFRDSVRDMDKQKELMTQDTDVRSLDVLGRQILVAEEEWKAAPNDPAKLTKLVELLRKTENPEHENRAIELLESAYEQTKQFRYREAAGNIMMTQLTRMERTLRADLATDSKNESKIKAWQDFRRDKFERELHIYQEQMEAYPTDMSKRYHVGARLFELGRYDEAIPIFQQSRADPKFKVQSSIALGRAFLEADFVDEAADTFKDLIEGYEIKNDAKYTEMLYWYGRALEKKNDVDGALKAYSAVAQANFNYMDVQARIKRLRDLRKQQPQPPLQ
jgi:tetratricopeptide (TPR) repeat protein